MATLLNRRRYMGGEDAPKEDKRVIATFNVIDDTSTTRVLYSTANITSVEIDGVSQEVTTHYQLSLGYHDVKIGISNPSSVPDALFSACGRLATCVLSSVVTSIGSSAFQNCKVLESVTVNATNPPTLGSSIFRYVTSAYKIYVPSESVDTYKAASGWSSFASRIQAIPT